MFNTEKQVKTKVGSGKTNIKHSNTYTKFI